MDQVGYAKIATRARARAPPPARPDRTVTVTVTGAGAGVVGRGSWAVDPWPVVRGPRSVVRGLWSVVWVWDWDLDLAWLGLAWHGLDWIGLDWIGLDLARNPYIFWPIR